MFYLAGLIRSTVLYLIPISLISGTLNPVEPVAAYLLLSLIHIAICKLTHDGRNASNIFTGALWHDIIAPFLRVKSCIEVLLKIHIIKDTPDHILEDKLQVYSGGIWGVYILLLLYSAFISR